MEAGQGNWVAPCGRGGSRFAERGARATTSAKAIQPWGKAVVVSRSGRAEQSRAEQRRGRRRHTQQQQRGTEATGKGGCSCRWRCRCSCRAGPWLDGTHRTGGLLARYYGDSTKSNRGRESTRTDLRLARKEREEVRWRYWSGFALHPLRLCNCAGRWEWSPLV